MDSINGLDILLTAVVLVSGVFALLRGFFGEMLGIGSWIVSGAGGVYLLPYVSPLTDKYISHPMLSNAVAGVASSIMLLIVLTMICSFLTGLVKKSMFNGIDHGLGFIFGCARGVLIWILVYFLLYLLAPQVLEDVSKGSKLFPYLETVCMKTKDHLPESLFDNPSGDDGDEDEEAEEKDEKKPAKKEKKSKKKKSAGEDELQAVLTAISKDEVDVALDEVKKLPKDDPLRKMLEEEGKDKPKGRLGSLWEIIKLGRQNMQKKAKDEKELFDKLKTPEIKAKKQGDLYDKKDKEDLNRLILESVEDLDDVVSD